MVKDFYFNVLDAHLPGHELRAILIVQQALALTSVKRWAVVLFNT